MISAELLQTLLVNHQVIPVKFAGHRMLFDAAGVVIWPQQDLLIFSDLHFEKGSFLSQFANPLPRFDSKDTLKRMQALIERYTCTHIVCLGDSLHDDNALSRMQHEDLTQLNALVTSVPKWTWVLGNHDPDIPPEIKGERATSIQCQNVLLVHEPEDLDEYSASRGALVNAQIVGHYHPKSTYRLANRRVTGKTFVCAPHILLMPAFGKYTGGLDIKDSAFEGIFDIKESSIYMSYHQKIYLL